MGARSVTTIRSDFDSLTLDDLRTRTSEKWRRFSPDVLPTFVAETDFPLAPAIRDALHAAVDRGDTGYVHFEGVPEAFARFAAAWSGWRVDPTRVAIMADVLMGVAEVLRVFTKPGDRVVINTPAYPPFWPFIREYGLEVVEAPLARRGARYELDLARLEAAFASGAHAFLLCNPHNPTGRVFSRDDLVAIAQLAERHGVAVVSDEIHGLLTLPGATHTPFVSLPEAAHGLSASVTSPSKAFNLPGLKCAFAVAGSDAAAERFKSLPPEIWARAGNFGVIASLAAFSGGSEWLRGLVAHLDGNRALLHQLLKERLPAITYGPPEATYLAWLDCNALGFGPDPAAAFLERGQVALAPGTNFGKEGSGFVRLNFGTTRAILVETVERMARAIAR